MTTRVKIENLEELGHKLKVTFASRMSNAVHSSLTVAPGESHETYIHSGLILYIEEEK
jgi:hypothetical protein